MLCCRAASRRAPLALYLPNLESWAVYTQQVDAPTAAELTTPKAARSPGARLAKSPLGPAATAAPSPLTRLPPSASLAFAMSPTGSAGSPFARRPASAHPAADVLQRSGQPGCLTAGGRMSALKSPFR